jgi:hypothetical protein
MKRAIPVAVLATGCFSIPPFEPPNAVQYTEDGAGALVAGDTFSLHFADGPGFHFPDSLKIGGAEMIGNEPGRECFEESQIGLRIAPTRRITADNDAMHVTNQLASVLQGPAVVQVKLDWAIAFTCSGDRRPSGTSTFTVFPDGRIVRYDQLGDASSPDVDGAGLCACDAAGVDFTVATFWTLARGAFRDLYRPDIPGKQPVPQGSEEVPNVDKTCVDDGTNRVAFAWPQLLNTSIRGTPQLISFGRSFLVSESVLPGGARSVYENSTALLLGNKDCTVGFDRAEEHDNPSPLAINGNPATYSFRDGIYGGPGETDFVLQDVHATLVGPVKSSFAVRLQFPRKVGDLHARLDNAQGRWYLPQRIDDRTWIVWFRDPLAAGTITVEPL